MKNKFKWFIYIIICAVLLPLVSVVATSKEKTNATASDLEISSSASEIQMVSGDFVGTQIFSSEDALNMLDSLKETFGFSSSREALKFNKCVESVTGFVYRFDQYFNGYKVYGGQLNVSVNSYGRATSINGTYFLNLEDVSFDISYGEEDAKEAILSLGATSSAYLETNIIKTSAGGYIAYIFEAEVDGEVYKVFVSARTLKVTEKIPTSTSLRDSLPTSNYTIENVATTQTNYDGEKVTLYIDKYTSNTSGEYFYILGDGERGIFVTNGLNSDSYSYKYYDSYMADGSFTDSAAVQAYQYIMKCYDFYLDSSNFGVSIEGLRNANGKEITLIAIVHYGVNYENAAYSIGGNSSTVGYFLFGDGNQYNNTGSFVQGLDVVGHEYQHAISESIVEFAYQNASGALAEAFSDIFGAVIEGHDISDPDFWRMGEDVYLTNSYFRDMSNPSATGCTYSYTNMFPFSSNPNEGNDYGGIHYNSTLMTYATYLMYCRDPEFFTTTNILKLWYQTLTKLTTTADFEDFAVAMLASASELGFSSDNIQDIEYAFAGINLPGYSGEETWNGNSLTIFQGSGTLASPYIISGVSDLASLAYYVNKNIDDGAYATARYTLASNIDLENVEWIAIGTSTYPFNGTFNGGSYTISGLNIAGQGEFAGLFGYAGENAYIYNLNIASGNNTISSEYAGAIVGRLEGDLSSCSSALNISGVNVGGLVGLMINTGGGQKITNSYTTGDLEGTGMVGGLVAEFVTNKDETTGNIVSGYISSCYATGTLTGLTVGGIVGSANGLYLINSISTTYLITNSSNSSVGGLVGTLSFVSGADVALNKVSNYIISCKSAASFYDFSSLTNVSVGLIVGTVRGSVGQGNVYIANNTAKVVGSYQYVDSNASNIEIKYENNLLSTDEIFEGDFDFDSEKYFKDTSNWTILEGNEAFDLTATFSVTSGQMPTLLSARFWLDYAASGFAGGNGTESSPYQISSAEELALLANLLTTDYYYNIYANRFYELTNDIDLSGKLWIGIGYTRITVIDGVTASAVIKAFRGSFNGNGYTIYNMNTVGAYSVSAINATGTSYYLYEFLPALFGTTCVQFNQSTVTNPTIKNLNIEDVVARGGYAAGVVSKAYYALDLENVTVMGGSITSSGIAGGLVAYLGGLNENVALQGITSSIKNCYTLVEISGNIAGGAVGYVTNASSTIASTLQIINYLNRGNIRASGINYDSYYDGSSYGYYRAVAGSVVGIVLNRELQIINSMNMGNVVAYNENPMIGGFIGATGVGDLYTQSAINILIDGCKQMGAVYYIFDNVLSSAGSVLGATHASLDALVNITITNTTHSVLSGDAIFDNAGSGTVTITNNMVVSSDNIGGGDFDIYSENYYSNPNYFNSSYYWTENETERLYFKVVFKNYDGTTLATVSVKEGEEITLPDITPTRESTAAYDFTFIGWSDSLSDISRNMTVYAEYSQTIRSYEITYVDEDGNVLETMILEYGSPVNQDVEAPEKQGNFFLSYEFAYWGEEGQTVTGEMTVKPVYKTSLTGVGIAIVFVLAIVVFGGIVALASRKKIR